MAGHFVTARSPSLTQGAIIQGLRIPGYEGTARHGLLITARCDLEHVRTTALNLLPVVPLEPWLRRDGAFSILLARINSLQTRALERIEELDERLLLLCREQDPVAVLEQFASDEVKFPPQKISAIKDTLGEMARYREFYSQSARAGNVDLDGHDDIAKLFKGQAADRVRLLLKNDVPDAHFLPSIDIRESLDECKGYAVIFRAILTIPGIIASRLERGLDAVEVRQDEALAQLLERPLLLDDEPIGVVSNVVSPHIEHILQRFAAMFSRIGVEDFRLRYKERLVDRLGIGKARVL